MYGHVGFFDSPEGVKGMKGLTHIYHGDGKGKTTCAVGLSVRAAGSGKKVLFLQFLKGAESCELRMLEQLSGITVVRSRPHVGFTWEMTAEEKELVIEHHNRCLVQAWDGIMAGHYQMLVLDEILGAYQYDMIDQNLFRRLVEEKPEETELVLTGMNPPEWLIASADYISHIQKEKHPYDRGVEARIGIEY